MFRNERFKDPFFNDGKTHPFLNILLGHGLKVVAKCYASRAELMDMLMSTMVQKVSNYYLLVDITSTHHVRQRCLTCFGNLLLSCFDGFGSQIGSTESGNPVWTHENL